MEKLGEHFHGAWSVPPETAASFYLRCEFLRPGEGMPDALWPGAEWLRSHRAKQPYWRVVARTKRAAASERRVTCSF